MTREEKRLLKELQGAERRRKRRDYTKTNTAQRVDRRRRRIDIRAIDDDDFEENPVAEFEPRSKRNNAAAGKEAMVIAVGGGSCRVLCGAGELNCRAIPGTAAGDRVMVSEAGSKVIAILPRASTLSRPDPGNAFSERVIAANMDLVVVVVSVIAPPLRPGLIDRYLIAIEKGGAQPVLCVNKIDLLESDTAPELAAIQPYRDLNVPVILCSAAASSGIDRLLDTIAGKLCVFVGHSGVGKSSLLNAIHPDLQLATKTVSEGNQKGRHTTTSSTLYRLPNGARIIDTPGVREFGLWNLDRRELDAYFHDFDAHASQCEFSDCTHMQEPGCAIRHAVAEGKIASARYQAYLRIGSSLG